MGRKSRAFTLVELLAVVGITTLLLSLLLPTIAKAREMARKTQCSSNLHQIGILLVQYSHMYNGLIPKAFDYGLWENPVGTPVNTAKTDAYWGACYLPLVCKINKNPSLNTEPYQKAARSLWRCPDGGSMDADLNSAGVSHYNPDQPAHYGANIFTSNTKLTQWQNSSEIIYAQDSAEHLIEGQLDSLSSWNKPKNLGSWRPPGTGNPTYFPGAMYEYYRHSHSCNVLWLDGHVNSIAESLGKDVPIRWYKGVDVP